MTVANGGDSPSLASKMPPRLPRRWVRRRGRAAALVVMVLVLIGLFGGASWIVTKGLSIKQEISDATALIPNLRQQFALGDNEAAKQTVQQMHRHTMNARNSADDPLWNLASGLPLIGANISAGSEVARSANDVVGLGVSPLVDAWGSLDWNELLPSGKESNLGSLKAASPTVASAAFAVRVSTERLSAIDQRPLLPQIAEPLAAAIVQLSQVSGALDTAADVSRIAPAMLGADSPKSYLLIVQNNAEARASGGIPGALAVLTLDKGKLSLGTQTSASEFGVMSPPVSVDPQQQQIYSSRLGKFIQDINLTPDFPSAAATARAMWKAKTGQDVAGVLSVDPVALSYLLNATGPVRLSDPAVARTGMPTELNAKNVVSTLLSDVYSKIHQPDLQDAYFASVAQEVFGNLASGRSEPNKLIAEINRATEEGRISIWSSDEVEQDVIQQYRLSGAIAGPSVPPAQFGIYFNDGTGAKMDYYVKRTVQLIKECPRDGYEQITVRVTSMNSAPADAGTSLPAYVTGGGTFGVPPGSVQTNIVAYGPAQSHVETARQDGQQTAFAPYAHGDRPVGVLAVRLAPGETKTTEVTFGKIVQHVEPALTITPSVQPVEQVELPNVNAPCL